MLEHQHDTTRGSIATMNDLHTFKARAYTLKVNSKSMQFVTEKLIFSVGQITEN